MLVLARLLSPGDFGIITVALIPIGFAQLFVEIGVGAAIIRTKNLTEEHISTGFTVSLLNGVAMALIFLLINPLIAGFFNIPHLLTALNMLVVIFPLQMAAKISYSLMQRDMNFKKLAGNDIISYLAGYALVGVPLAYFGYGYKSLILATIVQTLVYSLLLFFSQPHKIVFKINKAIYKELIAYGSKSSFSNFFDYLAQNGDYFVVGKTMDVVSLGLYSRAYKLMDMANTMIGSVMTKVLFANFSKLEINDQKATPILKKSYEMVFIVFIPVAAISFLLAPEIVRVLLGKQWTDVTPIFQAIAVGMIFRMGQKVSSSFTKKSSAIKQMVYVQLFYFICVVAGAYIGTHFNLVAVALAVNCSILISFLLLTNLAVKHSEYKWSMLSSDFIHHLAINLPLIISVWAWSHFARAFAIPGVAIILGAFLIWIALCLIIIKVKVKWFFGDNTEWVQKKFLYKIPGFRKYNVV